MKELKQETIIQNKCYDYVISNLDTIISLSESNNLNNINSIIKLYVYNYLLENEQDYLLEESLLSNISDTFKSIFWSNTINTWTGKVSMANWLGGVTAKTVASGSFSAVNLASSGISEFLKKFGLPAALNTLVLRIAFVSIFPTVLIGMLIYSLVKYKDIIQLKNFERDLKTCIESIKLHNRKDFKSIYKNINSQYSNILKNKCSRISDNKQKLQCASTNYIKYMTDVVITELIIEYIKYIKNQKFDISYMSTFSELFNFKYNKDNLINRQFQNLYSSYTNCIDIYDFNNKKSSYISYLDSVVKKNIK